MNAWLDSLPRAEFFGATRPVPAYRACGVAGFYAALIAAFAATLLAVRSPLVTSTLAAVCALSFFLYTWLRRWVLGRECLVLIEHVWFALLSAAAALWLMREPVLVYLDVITPALCFFLAAGRAGCLLVGCCHGLPSSLGIRYPPSLVAEGFRAHWAGVRLFPVQLIELAGLAAIGATGLAAVPRAPAGAVLTWFLLAYAVLRFGLEGLRGDRRPIWCGLSQARWMSLAEIAAVCFWQAGSKPLSWVPLAGLLMLLAAALVILHREAARLPLLSTAHREELRAAAAAAFPAGLEPHGKTTSFGTAIAVSRLTGDEEDSLHVSISLPGGRRDLELLCEISAAAFPRLDPAACRYARGVIHLLLPPGSRSAPAPHRWLGDVLHGLLAFRAQNGESPNPHATPAAKSGSSRNWYFKVTAGPTGAK